MSTTERRQKVVKSHPRLSLAQQCKILNIHRSGLYYKPKSESPLNLELMKAIDAQFLEHPYYGVERMTDYLILDLGYHVNVKRIRRLYKIMGLQTIYRKPKTTIRDPKNYKYPYLLKGLVIDRPNQVWQTDITYIPMFRGFMYMNAIIDVYSRKYLIGVFQTQWTNSGVSSFLETLSLNMAIRRSITPIKGHNIPAPNILKCLKNMIFKYLWTAKEELWITFLLSASGSLLNMKRSI
ncbi:transposase [Galbibacter orientalis DSM 19592]|uniref:Transposase n=1 Tax=Galbibacter orientalis DSM 19592 TaxID=926559 RepID=I3CA98_9FLAO|nr:transposase [Galbibacter orientalis DSM 19592]